MHRRVLAALALGLLAGLLVLPLPLLWLAPAIAFAQPRPAPVAAPDGGVEPEAAPDSPRASLARYLELCDADEYEEAAGYLDLPEARRAGGPQLARRLKAVLDRQLSVRPELASKLPLGNPAAHLPAGVEEIGSIPGRGGPSAVRLIRHQTPEGYRWVFSRNTVERIDDWYGHLSDRWLRDRLPQPLLRAGPKGVLWWQWLALAFVFGGSWASGRLFGGLVRAGLQRRKGGNAANIATAYARIRAPVAFFCGLAGCFGALPALALFGPAEEAVERGLWAGILITLFWVALRTIDVLGARTLESPGTRGNEAVHTLVPLGARTLKVVLLVVAAAAVLSELGYSVTTLIAGLGIGGVALALAAQKTVENLFGSVSIGVDKPFRVGDFIRVEDVSGTVESIGLRSTRVRTLDRTRITLPNGKLADLRVECFSARDRIRHVSVLGLARDTEPDAVRRVLGSLEALLRASKKVDPDLSVTLVKISDAALDVEVCAWFATTDFDEFGRLRQELLLGILDLLAAAGVRLAVPSRAVRLEPPGSAVAGVDIAGPPPKTPAGPGRA